jgi:hypothetical protein
MGITGTAGMMSIKEPAKSAELVVPAGTGTFYSSGTYKYTLLMPKRNSNGDHRDIRDHDARRGRNY